jgi:hypothetical protein
LTTPLARAKYGLRFSEVIFVVTDFTLSALAEIARIPKRAVQLWADAGVIKANPSTMLQGSGVHRRFTRDEVIVACVVAPFAKQKMAIGGLEIVAICVRAVLSTPRQRAQFEMAVAGHSSNYVAAYWVEDGAALVIDEFGLMSDVKTIFNPRDARFKRAVKIDVVSLNEVLRDLPAKP